MRQFILIMMMTISINSICQNYAVPDGFVWTDKGEYLHSTDTKDKAIKKCKQAFSMHSSLDVEKIMVYENSKVPIFWYSLDEDERNKAMIFYCVKYRDGYDVVVKQIKNKDTYFFSIEEDNGEIINIFYAKQ
jgi:hypothetical protein